MTTIKWTGKDGIILYNGKLFGTVWRQRWNYHVILINPSASVLIESKEGVEQYVTNLCGY